MNEDTDTPLCPKYNEQVLPDEKDLCSLCHEHSASLTIGDHWATIEELNLLERSY